MSFLDLSLTWRSAFRSEIAEMAAREHRKTQYVEQTKKTSSVVTRETDFGSNVSKLVFGVNPIDADLCPKN